MSNEKKREPMLSDEALMQDMPPEMVGNVRSFMTKDDVTRETTRDWSIFDVRAFYEDLIQKGDLIPKSEVEAMLSDALGVDKVSVWAELGTKRGFGTRIEEQVFKADWSERGEECWCSSCKQFLWTWGSAEFPVRCPHCDVRVEK